MSPRNPIQAADGKRRVAWKVTVERITTAYDCGDDYCNCKSHRKSDSWTFYPTALSLENAGHRHEIEGDQLVTRLRDSDQTVDRYKRALVQISSYIGTNPQTAVQAMRALGLTVPPHMEKFL